MKKDNGGSAFPTSGSEHGYPVDGMTLRDYIAIKAMASLTSVYWSVADEYPSAKDMLRCQTETAYEMADAMIEARKK